MTGMRAVLPQVIQGTDLTTLVRRQHDGDDDDDDDKHCKPVTRRIKIITHSYHYQCIFHFNPFVRIKTAQRRTVIQHYGDWYTGR